MNIVVLTSQENYVWHSMQEIIPYIEETWKKANRKESPVTVLNVDNMSFSQITPYILNATHIVLTCFNVKICKTALFARETLNIDLNFIVYVHNMATIAFWPFRHWGRKNFFKKNDLFVTSCDNDRKTLLQVFDQCRVLVIPFFVLNYEKTLLNKTYQYPKFLVYIGRISSQKNLHNLILGYHLLRQKNISIPPLIFFGKEDHLGSPNMGLTCNSYQKYLDDLIKKYGLEDHVEFKGHVERNVINKFLTENSCLCISPSLHSDENFGMAVLQALLLGNRCIISDWGGHSDFKKYFSSRIELLPVNHSNWGPSLSGQQIAEGIHRFLESPISSEDITLNQDYDINYQVDTILKSLKTEYSSEDLGFEKLADSIFDSKNPNNTMQIFKDYTDINFHKISESYRGNYSKNFNFVSYKCYDLAPWLIEKPDHYEIIDPHKGCYKLEKTEMSTELLFNGSYLICKN